jgi:hypothetical protein
MDRALVQGRTVHVFFWWCAEERAYYIAGVNPAWQGRAGPPVASLKHRWVTIQAKRRQRDNRPKAIRLKGMSSEIT